MHNISWRRHEPGTWQPKDHNEFHNCSLFTATYGEMTIWAHRTKDARRWIAAAHTTKHGVPTGKALSTRKAAFWDAVNRLARYIDGERR